ncbi:ABC transporter permease [Paraherbaspirillum soli]|uniref:ABC transporter permease n=1 Tax=Paraherbaspirillum soli TaxID=631222 RepID=A0ABW0MED4_9BURK
MSFEFFIPVSFSEVLNHGIAGIVQDYGDALHDVSSFMLRFLLVPLESLLQSIPPWLILTAVGLISYHALRRIGLSLLSVAALYFIGCLGLWEKTIQTLNIMLVSIIICLLIGIPAGILMARSKLLSRLLLPVLDVMQTFPMFVYMLPAVMLFSIGKVPAVLATVIYALPPLIRLTELGIRQVDEETRDAAWSFGTTGLQLLLWVQLPLARPSIMAGINQTTMLALAMVVVASMIGARGLGEDILQGLTNLDFGKGAHAGIAVVILAIVIDRITQAYGMNRRQRAQLKQPE